MTNLLNVFIAAASAPTDGEWYDLLTEDGRHAALSEDMEFAANGKEAIISDYEADFSINEYDYIERLIKIGEHAEDMDESERAVFFAELDDYVDVDDLADEINNGYYDIISVDCSLYNNSHEALGWYFREIGAIHLDEVAERYFDYEAFGRDCAFDYHEVEADGSYVFYRC